MESENKESSKRNKVVVPATDVIEDIDKGSFFLYADMPGLDQTTLEVRVEQKQLLIAGKMKAFQRSGTLWQSVTRDRDFKRVFSISDAIDTSAIHAEYTQGVLRVELPKAQHVKPRKIEVKVTHG